MFGNRRRAEKDVAEAGAQEEDHVFSFDPVQARLQGEHRVELGLLDQRELDQQRAELAVVLRLPLEGGVESRPRHEAGASEELAKPEVGRISGAVFQERR